MIKNQSQNVIEVTEKYSAHNYHPLPVVIAKAMGIWVEDPEGHRYMDFLSAYSAVNQGHCHPRIIAALKQQADACTLTSRAFYNDQMGPFLKLLCEIADMEMALPMNTGAEAVETAIKASRRWGYEVKGVPENQAEIIVCSDNFHGRTTTIVGFSSEPGYKKGFGPFTPGFVTVPYGDIAAFQKAVNKNTVGFLFEPIQGEAGVVVPPDDYFSSCAKICQQEKILTMADEIQTGLGRTGKWFCVEHYGFKPDMYILGKALGGGVLPVSAVTSSKEVLGVFTYGSHGSTFGGNPLASRVALESLCVIRDEKLVENAAELGPWFLNELRSIPSTHIELIRGKGLMIGMVLKKEARGARRFCEALMKLGLLCKETHENVIRFAPPLIIKKSELETALEKIRSVLMNPELL